MNIEFKNYHPIVNFTYFIAVTGLSMLIMNPFVTGISVLGAAIFTVVIKKQKAIKFLSLIIPVMLMSALFNPLFNHGGETILFYFPKGTPFTLEAMVYGLFAGLMLSSVICWFSCFNVIMTGDKLMYLTGRILPSISLIFSMCLRFVPRFSAQLKKMTEAQRCLDTDDPGIKNKARQGVRILSAMISFALVSSIKTADSMKARHYGKGKRTSFSIYTIRGRDIFAFVFIVSCTALLLWFRLRGYLDYRYFPDIRFGGAVYSLPFGALCLLPTVIEIWEVLRWKFLRSQI